MRFGIFHAVFLVAVVTGCSSTNRIVTPNFPEPAIEPQPYVRILNTGSNHVQLQIAAREFLPSHSREPVVWLTGVAHIGDSNYYAGLQAHLDAQSLVLFEGVGAAEAEASANANVSSSAASTNTAPKEPGVSNDNGSLQSAMAASLGLVFQLQAIDYQRTNF